MEKLFKKDLGNFGILITGGGTGIGKACAAEMYSNGALVTICGRTEEKLKQSVQEIVESQQKGGAIQYVICDVTDEDQVLKTVLAADEFGKGLDGVVASSMLFQCCESLTKLHLWGCHL